MPAYAGLEAMVTSTELLAHLQRSVVPEKFGDPGFTPLSTAGWIEICDMEYPPPTHWPVSAFELPDRLRHSGLMLANLITFAHFSTSAVMKV